MSRFYWIFGLIAGAVYIVLDFMYHQGVIDREKIAVVFISQILLFILCVVFASVAYKKINGKISFMRTVFGAVMVGLIASTVIIGGRIALSSSIDNYTEATKDYNFKMVYEAQTEDGRTEEWINEQREKIEHKYSLGNLIQVTLVGYLFFGAIIGAFTAAFIADRSSIG